MFIPRVYFCIAKIEKEQLFLQSCIFFVCFFSNGNGGKKSLINSNCYHNKNPVNAHKSHDKFKNLRAAPTYMMISHPKLETAELCKTEPQLNSIWEQTGLSSSHIYCTWATFKDCFYLLCYFNTIHWGSPFPQLQKVSP